jgi:hypothetical protein
MAEDQDYLGQHQPPMKGEGAPLWRLTDESIYPADIYGFEAHRLYSFGGPGDHTAISIMRSMRNKPNRLITVYRAVPKDLPKTKKKFERGNWVALTRAYAKEHGESNLGGQYSILSKSVYARDLFTDGNSVQEWGYDPQPRVPDADYLTPQEIEIRRAKRAESAARFKEQRKEWKKQVTERDDRWNNLKVSMVNGQIKLERIKDETNDIRIEDIETGVPISGYLYHGSKEDDLEILQPKHPSYEGSLGFGLYLAEYGEASNYGQYVYRVPVHFKNPFKIGHSPIEVDPHHSGIDENLLDVLAEKGETFASWLHEWSRNVEIDHPHGDSWGDAVDHDGKLPNAFLKTLAPADRKRIEKFVADTHALNLAKKEKYDSVRAELNKKYMAIKNEIGDKEWSRRFQELHKKHSNDFEEMTRAIVNSRHEFDQAHRDVSKMLESKWDEWPENNVPLLSDSVLVGEHVRPFWFMLGDQVVGVIDRDGMEDISSLVREAGYDALAVEGLRDNPGGFLNHEVVVFEPHSAKLADEPIEEAAKAVIKEPRILRTGTYLFRVVDAESAKDDRNAVSRGKTDFPGTIHRDMGPAIFVGAGEAFRRHYLGVGKAMNVYRLAKTISVIETESFGSSKILGELAEEASAASKNIGQHVKDDREEDGLCADVDGRTWCALFDPQLIRYVKTESPRETKIMETNSLMRVMEIAAKDAESWEIDQFLFHQAITEENMESMILGEASDIPCGHYNVMTDQSAKVIKGQKFGVLTGILYIGAADTSGIEACPARSGKFHSFVHQDEPGINITHGILNKQGVPVANNGPKAKFHVSDPKRARKSTLKLVDELNEMDYIRALEHMHSLGYEQDKGCTALCLGKTSGLGKFKSTQQARVKKTLRLIGDDEEESAKFLNDLDSDIRQVIRRAAKFGLKPAIRLNGTSDLYWHKRDRLRHRGLTFFDKYPDTQFYDYTKNYDVALDYLAGKLPANYHLTFSYSGQNWMAVENLLKNGMNVAVGFRKLPNEELPVSWRGFEVIDGDSNDIRFLDPKTKPGKIVGLTPKGRSLLMGWTTFFVEPDDPELVWSAESPYGKDRAAATKRLRDEIKHSREKQAKRIPGSRFVDQLYAAFKLVWEDKIELDDVARTIGVDTKVLKPYWVTFAARMKATDGDAKMVRAGVDQKITVKNIINSYKMLWNRHVSKSGYIAPDIDTPENLAAFMRGDIARSPRPDVSASDMKVAVNERMTLGRLRMIVSEMIGNW